MTDDQNSNLVNVQRSPTDDRRERGERILDAAAELVLRWGYKRVTIEDVAKLAGIGKGTVYLHWRNRESLFMAVLLRDSLVVVDKIIDAMRADPVNVLPSRSMRMVFEESMTRPLLAAMLTRDYDVLGRLAERGAVDATIDDEASIGVTREYLRLLREHGLVRTDLDPDTELYLFSALGNGFCLVQPWLPKSLDLPVPVKAEALAHTFRTALEPPDEPDREALAAVAPHVIGLYQGMREVYASAVYAGTTGTNQEGTQA
jgi:AcrR family transcriptional regulator